MFCRVIIVALVSVVAWAQSEAASAAQHLQLGIEAQQGGNLQLAIDEFRKSVEADPSGAEANARLGMAYQTTGMLPQAAEALERALATDPSLPGVGVLLGFTYQKMGNNGKAALYLAKAFESEQNVRVRLLVGQRLVDVYFGSGDFENGLKIIQELRRLAPKDPDVLYTASKAYANLWNSAVEALVNTAPDSYRVHQVFAEVFEAQERFADAAKEYRQIIRMQPDLPGVHYRLGRMILGTADTPENDKLALEQFQKELTIQPDDVPTFLEIGEINLRAQRLDEAEKDFTRALALQAGNLRGMIGLSKVYLERKQYDRAIVELQRAARIAGDDANVHYNLMLAYRSLGRASDAQIEYAQFQRLKTGEQQRKSSLLNQLKGLPGSNQSSRP